MGKMKKLKAKDRNLVRIRKAIDAEFEIENLERLESQKGKWFKDNLDYRSFVCGFSKGVKYLSRVRTGDALEDEDD